MYERIEAAKEIKMKSSGEKRFKLKRGFLIALACTAGAVALLCVYCSQDSKLKSIHAAQKELQEQIDALESEEERMEYMIEYAQSDEYLLQYAREKLGYIKPGEIKFDIED